MIEFRVGGGLKGEKKIGGLLRRSIDSGNLNVIWVGIVNVFRWKNEWDNRGGGDCLVENENNKRIERCLIQGRTVSERKEVMVEK